MFLGMVFGWLLAVTHKEKALANYNQTSGKNEKSLFTMMFNGWVGEALEVALVPLIVIRFRQAALLRSLRTLPLLASWAT